MLDALKLLVCVGGCQLAGAVAGWLTDLGRTDWYAGLDKPPLTPPGEVFGIVWPVLYLLMGVAAWVIWRRGLDAPGVRVALGLFVAQLAVNVAWSGAFFALQSPPAGLVVIVALWALIALTTVRFWNLSAWAGALMAPYLLWVTFAVYLNAGILALNA